MIVLDTHAWLWHLSEPTKLGRAARRTLDAHDRLLVSAVSLFEVAFKAGKGRLALDRPVGDWLGAAVATERIEVAAVTGRIAEVAGALDDFHGDPADRLIVATAVVNGCPLVTADAAITTWARTGRRLSVVW